MNMSQQPHAGFFLPMQSSELGNVLSPSQAQETREEVQIQPGPPLSLHSTSQFYDWETRGRGWRIWPYCVCLEPPFRPFISHNFGLLSSPRYDDGRHPTILSRITGFFGQIFSGSGIRVIGPFPPMAIMDAIRRLKGG